MNYRSRISAVLCVGAIAASVRAQTVVYLADFDAGLPAEFSGEGVVELVHGYDGLGPTDRQFGGLLLRNDSAFPSQPTVLHLAGLPQHTAVTLQFLLAVIDTWDGDFSVDNAPAPDLFYIRVDGAEVFAHTLSNFNANREDHQSYAPPSGVLLTTPPLVDLGWQQRHDFGDAAYDMGVEPLFTNIPHTASTLTIEWQAGGGGWQGGLDESWAIDQLTVLVSDDCPADFNGDGTVNTVDVLSFLNAWSGGDSSADFNADGNVDTLDMLAFLNAWAAGCP